LPQNLPPSHSVGFAITRRISGRLIVRSNANDALILARLTFVPVADEVGVILFIAARWFREVRDRHRIPSSRGLRQRHILRNLISRPGVICSVLVSVRHCFLHVFQCLTMRTCGRASQFRRLHLTAPAWSPSPIGECSNLGNPATLAGAVRTIALPRLAGCTTTSKWVTTLTLPAR